MNSLKKSLNVLCLLVLTASAFAQTHEVLMKNRGSAGPMVYEPDYLEIQPGDTVKFIRKHKSHNAASIAELSPAGYPGFIGKIDEEIAVKYDNAGFYGIKCTQSCGHVLRSHHRDERRSSGNAGPSLHHFHPRESPRLVWH